jgi:hypothetical protein
MNLVCILQQMNQLPVSGWPGDRLRREDEVAYHGHRCGLRRDHRTPREVFVSRSLPIPAFLDREVRWAMRLALGGDRRPASQYREGGVVIVSVAGMGLRLFRHGLRPPEGALQRLT